MPLIPPKRLRAAIAVAAFLVPLSAASGASAQSAGDPAKGQALYVRCATCHSLEAGANKLGPSLHGILGRKAGSTPGFRYSPAMKASGITWSQENLDRFIAAPRSVVPGTSMAYVGISQPQDRAHLLAYLAKATTPRK